MSHILSYLFEGFEEKNFSLKFVEHIFKLVFVPITQELLFQIVENNFILMYF